MSSKRQVGYEEAVARTDCKLHVRVMDSSKPGFSALFERNRPEIVGNLFVVYSTASSFSPVNSVSKNVIETELHSEKSHVLL
ncbi:hypothetical protein EV128_12629 [Rhizobium azibense]|nr:hypothetical protein EV128_12629 [Rhizobium azibense]